MHYHAALVYALNYLQDNYMTILAYLGAGGGLSLVIQFLKKLRNWERGAWIQFVLGVFTVLASTADYIIQNYSTGTIPTIFGDMTPKLFVAAVIMHRIAVNPLTKLVEGQVQKMVNRAATKAADSVTVTGQITPHISEPVTTLSGTAASTLYYHNPIAPNPSDVASPSDDGVAPML